MWAPARSRRRWESVGAAVTALVAAVIGVLWVSPDVAGAFHGPDTARTAGAGRIRTAAAVARQAHPDGGIACADRWRGGLADALAAAPLTRSPDAPLLLTRRAELPEATDRAGLPLEFFGWGLLSESDGAAQPEARVTAPRSDLQRRLRAADARSGSRLRVALAVGLFAVGGWFAVRGLFALAVSAWWETSDDPLDGPVMVLWGLQVVVALGLPALLARLLLGRRARWWLLALGAVGGVMLGYVAFAVPEIVEELTETP